VNLTVKGRNLVLTDAISRYAEEKLGRLGKYVANGTRCEVELWTEKNPSIADNQVVEVTIFTKGPVIRAREASPDIYASIDLVFAKLERQVKKYRGKLVSRYQGARKEAKEAALASEGFNIPEEAEEPEAETPSPTIVNRWNWSGTTSSCSRTPSRTGRTWCTAARTATTGISSPPKTDDGGGSGEGRSVGAPLVADASASQAGGATPAAGHATRMPLCARMYADLISAIPGALQ